MSEKITFPQAFPLPHKTGFVKAHYGKDLARNPQSLSIFSLSMPKAKLIKTN